MIKTVTWMTYTFK